MGKVQSFLIHGVGNTEGPRAKKQTNKQKTKPHWMTILQYLQNLTQNLGKT